MAGPKKLLRKKLLEFRVEGLHKYGNYLDQQLKDAGDKKIKKQYRKYLEEQIGTNNKKIKRISEKIKAI